MTQSIRSVVDSLLCLSCGACVAVCPHRAVTMRERPGGLLWPVVDEHACQACGLCAAVCPGSHLDEQSLDPGTDPFEGPILAAYRGQATVRDLLLGAQSGGLASALLINGLDKSLIDLAVVTRWAADGSLRPVTMATADQAEVLAARGSKYCPVPLVSQIYETLSSDKRIAIVGLPCHVHALVNAGAALKSTPRHRPLIIGLVCQSILSYLAIDYLLESGRMTDSRIAEFAYRSKRWRGWPGDTYVRDGRGRERHISSQVRMECKDLFTPPRCRLCFDKLNVLSDITLGDGYGLAEDKDGASAVLVRTEAGEQFLAAATSASAVALDPVQPAQIMEGQALDLKRSEWTAYSQAWTEMGRCGPRLPVPKRWAADLTGVDLSSFRSKLMWGIHMAESDSRPVFMRSVRRRVLGARVRRLLSPSRGLRRGVRWIRSMARKAGKGTCS